MSFISRGLTSHHTGTVPLCSTTGATSSIDRTSMVTVLPPLRRREGYAETSAMSEKAWREEWDEQADDWVELTGDDPFYDLLNEPALLDLLPPPGRRTLDVGCGEGRLARRLVERGHRVVGLDGSES